MKLAKKIAVVTGAGSGIGKAIALRFLREGASVLAVDIDPRSLAALVAEAGPTTGALTLQEADLGNLQSADAIISQALKSFGAIHILVNNAADTRLQKSVQDLSIDEWDHCLKVSLSSVFLLSKLVGPIMRDLGGGSILNLGSVGGTSAWAGGAAYCAAKSSIVALTQVLAIEYGPWKIRVNTISPGAIMTPNLQASIDRNHHIDRLQAKSVLGRIGEPDEVANVAAFLASDEASYVTSANFFVDGGWK